MKRVMIIGGPGSGKSTLAVRIGRKLDIPVTHLDRLFFTSNWVERPKETFISSVTDRVGFKKWIIEGNYFDTWPMRSERADTVIFLDLNTITRFYRVIKRWWRYRGQTRPDLAPGCPEKIDLFFLWWVIWIYPQQKRKEAVALCEALRGNKNIYHLTKVRDVEMFLDDLG